MMAAKARLFRDEESLSAILDSSDPKTAKLLAGKLGTLTVRFGMRTLAV